MHGVSLIFFYNPKYRRPFWPVSGGVRLQGLDALPGELRNYYVTILAPSLDIQEPFREDTLGRTRQS
jgi:hypothetical protein